MKILSMSTATNYLSVALNDGQTVVAQAEEKDQRNHSEHLDPLIAKLLKQVQWTLPEIDRFVVAIGPGSYTGLRIGLTTAKMFASILQKDLVGISTLQALAANAAAPKALLVTGLDARNDNFFAGAYQSPAGIPENILADGHYPFSELLQQVQAIVHQQDLEQVLFIGTGFAQRLYKIKAALPGVKVMLADQQDNQVHAGVLGQLGESGQPTDPDQLLPRYLRRTQAEMDWHRKTGRPYGPDSNYVEEV